MESNQSVLRIGAVRLLLDWQDRAEAREDMDYHRDHHHVDSLDMDNHSRWRSWIRTDLHRSRVGNRCLVALGQS